MLGRAFALFIKPFVNVRAQPDRVIAAFDHRALKICEHVGSAFARGNDYVAAPAVRRTAQAVLTVGLFQHIDAFGHGDKLGDFAIVE